MPRFRRRSSRRSSFRRSGLRRRYGRSVSRRRRRISGYRTARGGIRM